MSTIRRQSIISSFIIYIGFAVGAVNTYFFGREGQFSVDEYGLTGIFVAIASMMMAFALMGLPPYIFKFYPYYKDHLPPKKIDMLTWALLISAAGFIAVMLAGWFLRDVIIRKFGERSQLLVSYYYWIFPMGFGLTVYTILEVYAWNFNKAVLTSYLREVQWRIFTTILIVLFSLHIIKDFDLFIKLYAFTYPAIAVILFVYLVATHKAHFTFTVSKVSKRYFKQIIRLCSFVYVGNLIQTTALVFDSLVIASLGGLASAGIFGLAQYVTSVIQAPQRAIVASSISHLSRAWKEKDMELLQRVYQRSSINMLIFACGIFILIALNYRDAIITFGLKSSFLLGFNAFLILGITRVIDLGVGVSSQIIATSTKWKFELTSGLILLAFMLPLSYILAKQYGIIGPAIANLVAISVYNIVRIGFLWKKFRLFPFTIQSLYATILAAACYTICYFLFREIHGLPGLVLRSLAFIILFGAGVIGLKLSPDVKPVWQTILKRVRLKKD
ncbi:MAG: lipopolysaccharide biosynthesis protein [Chitinophagaceae bacterium]|nr:lipopolysaccharide biosynthesis protein [Chitinophagaceae bacterium]